MNKTLRRVVIASNIYDMGSRLSEVASATQFGTIEKIEIIKTDTYTLNGFLIIVYCNETS